MLHVHCVCVVLSSPLKHSPMLMHNQLPIPTRHGFGDIKMD